MHNTHTIIKTIGLSAAALCGACGSADTAPVPVGPAPVVSSDRVDISAMTSRLALGDRLALTYKVYVAGGQLREGVKPNWSVSDSTKARVDSNGVVTGFALGDVDIIANYIGSVGRFRVTMLPGTGTWGGGYIFGGSNNDGGENIVTDAAGNVYVGGSTAGTVDGQSATFASGQADALVTRFLPNGKKAWTRVVLLPGRAGANGIALHRDGGVVVNSSNTFGSFVSYVDASGRVVWKKEYVNAGFNDIATDRAGNIYVIGNALRLNTGSICPGVPLPAPNSVVGGGAGDGLLLKFSPSGEQLWCNLWTYVQPDQVAPKVPVFDTQGVSIAIDEARDAIWVGGVIQLNAIYGLSPYIRRFSLSTGSSALMKFVNPTTVADAPGGRIGSSFGAEYGLLLAVVVDGAGDVWAGTCESALGTPATGLAAAQLVKMSALGTQLFRRTLSVADAVADRATTALAYRAQQNDVVAVLSYGTTFLIPWNAPNGTLIAHDMSGAEKWRTRVPEAPFTGPATTSVRAISATTGGDLFAVGDTRNIFASYPDDAPAGEAGLNIFVARVAARP